MFCPLGNEGHAARSLSHGVAREMAQELSLLGESVAPGVRLWGQSNCWDGRPGEDVVTGMPVFFLAHGVIHARGVIGRCFEFNRTQSRLLWPAAKEEAKGGYYHQVFEVQRFRAGLRQPLSPVVPLSNYFQPRKGGWFTQRQLKLSLPPDSPLLEPQGAAPDGTSIYPGLPCLLNVCLDPADTPVLARPEHHDRTRC